MSDGLFWWHFWIAVQVAVVALVIVGLGLFIRWGRRRAESRGTRDS